jgi:hypothetical protein
VATGTLAGAAKVTNWVKRKKLQNELIKSLLFFQDCNRFFLRHQIKIWMTQKKFPENDLV